MNWPRMGRSTLSPGLHQRGFTLLEILLVVTIIGVMAGLAVLAIGGNESRYLQLEAERLQHIMQLAQDEASFQQDNLGLRLSDDGYEFMRFDALERDWVTLNEPPFQPHLYPLPLQVDLQLEGSPLQLKEKSEQPQPQILFLASGENSTFVLYLALANNPDSERQLYSDGFSAVMIGFSGDDK